MRKLVGHALAVFVGLAVAAPASAGLFKRDCCDPCCDPCTHEKVMQKCTVKVCEYKEEVRERKVCVWEPETRTKTIKYTECKPVVKEEKREYTVLVPHTETRKGTRKVCKFVETKEKRKVCVDEGHWEEVCCAKRCRGCCVNKCGGCGNCCKTKRVWCCKPVEKEIEVVCRKPTWVDEEYEYCVTVCKEEKRTCTVKVCTYEKVEKSRECKYTVCVPKEKVVQCKVMVPHLVEKEIEVEVCKAGCKDRCCKVRCKDRCKDRCDPCCPPRRCRVKEACC
jgi:hypothetical protein